MARFIEMEERDYASLVSALQYVINRHASDRSMVQYLQETLSKVTKHQDNERFGCDEASEIDAVMNFIAGEDAGRDDTTQKQDARLVRASGRSLARRGETRVVEGKDLQAMFKRAADPGRDGEGKR